MNSLTDGFKQPLPAWVDIKNDAVEKNLRSPFAADVPCRRHELNENPVSTLLAVCRCISKDNRSCLHILNKELVKTFGLEMIDVFRLGFQVLSSMQTDEEDHRELWLKTAYI